MLYFLSLLKKVGYDESHFFEYFHVLKYSVKYV